LQAGPALPADRHRPKDREITKWKFLFRSEKRTITAGATLYHIDVISVKLFWELFLGEVNFWFDGSVEAKPIRLDNEGGAFGG
jgi:hypothetical protein